MFALGFRFTPTALRHLAPLLQANPYCAIRDAHYAYACCPGIKDMQLALKPEQIGFYEYDLLVVSYPGVFFLLTLNQCAILQTKSKLLPSLV